MRHRRLAGYMAGLAAATLGLTGLATTSASAAPAPSCYGDYCSGQDPEATGCGADAITVDWRDLSGARLELRWSPSCQTNWARWQQYPVGMKSDVLVVLGVEQDTGYTQSHDYGVNGVSEGTYWSNMIYSPVRGVKAVALVQCGGMTLIDAAFSCATGGKVETESK
jgi:hypothetical protein